VENVGLNYWNYKNIYAYDRWVIANDLSIKYDIVNGWPGALMMRVFGVHPKQNYIWSS
jgi:inosine/xanthosine triphosphate pyrophosphatase family protein